MVGAAVTQHERGVGHDPGHLLDLVAGLIVVELQVLQDVVAVDLLHPHLCLRIGDGAEEQVQAALGGEDGALAQETDGRDLRVDVAAVGDGAFGVDDPRGRPAGDGGDGRGGGTAATALAGGQECGGREQCKDETG